MAEEEFEVVEVDSRGGKKPALKITEEKSEVILKEDLLKEKARIDKLLAEFD